MKLLSGFRHPKTPEWNAMIANLERSARRLRHEIEVADFPSMDPWLTVYPDIFQTVCWKYKLHFLLDHIKAVKEDVAWIDGDCLIWKRLNFDQIMEGCDIALTLRDIGERSTASAYPVQDGYLNTGVMFFRNNEQTVNFLERAKEHLLLSIYEQEAINKVILAVDPMAKHGDIIDVHGTRIKMLNCREYNFIYLHDPSAYWEPAKILHYKGEGRKIHKYHVERLFERNP